MRARARKGLRVVLSSRSFGKARCARRLQSIISGSETLQVSFPSFHDPKPSILSLPKENVLLPAMVL